MTVVPASSTTEAGSLAPAEAAAAARYRRSADAAETLRGYRRDWQAFAGWCADRHTTALPAAPATVGAHLAALADAGRALATLRRRLAAIARAHRSAGHRLDAGHPAIRETLRGIARSIGRPQRRAAALCTAELKAIAAACATEGEADPVEALAALRDRAPCCCSAMPRRARRPADRAPGLLTDRRAAAAATFQGRYRGCRGGDLHRPRWHLRSRP